jgi:hypothetical protein
VNIDEFSVERHEEVCRGGAITLLLVSRRGARICRRKVHATTRVREFRQVRYDFLTSDYSSGGWAVACNGYCRVPGFSSWGYSWYASSVAL